ncbi:hypothetical protein GCWU000341_02016 [Oribacterium sp. oral taxon 078 str. F0262]|nr:hypothetical protein GCWU000341_02016 [Oribacterium sp. oral taxon 078 str. F0262]
MLQKLSCERTREMLQYFSLLKRKSKDGLFGKPGVRKRRAREQKFTGGEAGCESL